MQPRRKGSTSQKETRRETLDLPGWQTDTTAESPRHATIQMLGKCRIEVRNESASRQWNSGYRTSRPDIAQKAPGISHNVLFGLNSLATLPLRLRSNAPTDAQNECSNRGTNVKLAPHNLPLLRRAVRSLPFGSAANNETRRVPDPRFQGLD